jgi:type II restriction enzyme
MDINKLFQEKKALYGADVYKHTSEILKEAKEIHKKEFKGGDFEQSWKPVKGNALEKLLLLMICDAVESLGLKIVKGLKFDITKPENLTTELKYVKRNLAIDFGNCGFHIPDADLIIYNPKTYDVISIISSKSTLRERIAQTAYWNIKIKGYEPTKHIKVFFMTPDEDGTLTSKTDIKKSRAIAETDIDGSYVLSEIDLEESDKVGKVQSWAFH